MCYGNGSGLIGSENKGVYETPLHGHFDQPSGRSRASPTWLGGPEEDECKPELQSIEREGDMSACPGGKYLKLGLIFPDTLSFTRQAITMDRYGQARLLVGRLGRFGPYDRAPAYDIGRNSPNDLCRKQDAHLEDGSGLNTLLRAEQNARPADVHGCSFVPVGLAALTIAKGCVNWESLGTWFVLTPFLTRIARQFITLV